MSRGPGTVERAIGAAFANNPAETFTVDELARLAYPGINVASQKHRVAVIRAADKVCAKTRSPVSSWSCGRAEHPGGQLVFFNGLNVRSYALGKLRRGYLGARLPISELVLYVDDPDHPKTEWHNMQPGEVWWRHVEIGRAELEGREADAAQMRVDLRKYVYSRAR